MSPKSPGDTRKNSQLGRGAPHDLVRVGSERRGPSDCSRAPPASACPHRSLNQRVKTPVRSPKADAIAERPDAVGAEHLVESSCELAVAVVDQKPDWLRPVDERLDDVPCLLGRPLSCRVRGDSREIRLPG